MASRDPGVTRWLAISLFRVFEAHVGTHDYPGLIDWRATVTPVRPVEKNR